MSKYMNAGLYTSNTDEWETPQEFFNGLDAEFHFTLDVCSTDGNAKCAKHYTKEQDGLSQDWSGETVWCNPPYGRDVWRWWRKCHEHAIGGGYSGDADTCQDGHGVVSRLGIWESGDTICAGTAAF